MSYMGTVWSISDLMAMLTEGTPGADLSGMVVNPNHGYQWYDPNAQVQNSNHGSVGINYQNYEPALDVHFKVKLPLDKIRDVSIPGMDLNQFVHQQCHPALWNDGNQLNMMQGFTLENEHIMVPVMVTLRLAILSKTARTIKDSNFYSLLDATLES